MEQGLPYASALPERVLGTRGDRPVQMRVQHLPGRNVAYARTPDGSDYIGRIDSRTGEIYDAQGRVVGRLDEDAQQAMESQKTGVHNVQARIHTYDDEAVRLHDVRQYGQRDNPPIGLDLYRQSHAEQKQRCRLYGDRVDPNKLTDAALSQLGASEYTKVQGIQQTPQDMYDALMSDTKEPPNRHSYWQEPDGTIRHSGDGSGRIHPDAQRLHSDVGALLRTYGLKAHQIQMGDASLVPQIAAEDMPHLAPFRGNARALASVLQSQRGVGHIVSANAQGQSVMQGTPHDVLLWLKSTNLWLANPNAEAMLRRGSMYSNGL